jgi:hypothetical protein
VLLALFAFGCPGDGRNLADDMLGDPDPMGPFDDFEDGSVSGWVEGGAFTDSPNPPTNVPDGGPDGVGDNYLENFSSGGFGPGSRLVMYNQAQWTGDYVAQGVTRIEAQMANLGPTDLFMRLAIEGQPFVRYGSTVAQPLPPDGQWYPLVFELNDASLTQIGVPAPLSDVLSGVTTLRILSASSGPAWEGDIVIATLGVDDILGTGDPTAN